MSSVGSLVSAIILIVVGFILGYAAKKNHIHAEIDGKISEVKQTIHQERENVVNMVNRKIDDVKKNIK